MNTEKIHQWLGVVANLGVLGGLLLLAVEINQNTQITKAQVINDYYLADMELELAMMGDDPAKSWVKAIFDPDNLTKEDAAVVDRYFNYGVVQIQRLHRMNELGLADDDWTERVTYLSWHLGNETGRRWWAKYQADSTDELVRAIDDALAENNYRQNQEGLEAMLPKTKRIQN